MRCFKCFVFVGVCKRSPKPKVSALQKHNLYYNENKTSHNFYNHMFVLLILFLRNIISFRIKYSNCIKQYQKMITIRHRFLKNKIFRLRSFLENVFEMMCDFLGQYDMYKAQKFTQNVFILLFTRVEIRID